MVSSVGRKARSGTTPPYNMRLPLALRRRLEECAKENDQPLAKEIVERLQESLREDRDIEKQFGNRKNYRIIQAINFAVQAVSDRYPDRDWLNDAEAFDLVVSAAIGTLLEIHPSGDATHLEPPYRSREHYLAAKEIAQEVWQPIVEAEHAEDWHRHRKIQRELKPIIHRPKPYRSEFQERFRQRAHTIMQQSDTPDRGPSDNFEQLQKWSRNWQSSQEAARREVEAEMIAEGKDPRLDQEEGSNG